MHYLPQSPEVAFMAAAPCDSWTIIRLFGVKMGVDTHADQVNLPYKANEICRAQCCQPGRQSASALWFVSCLCPHPRAVSCFWLLGVCSAPPPLLWQYIWISGRQWEQRTTNCDRKRAKEHDRSAKSGFGAFLGSGGTVFMHLTLACFAA